MARFKSFLPKVGRLCITNLVFFSLSPSLTPFLLYPSIQPVEDRIDNLIGILEKAIPHRNFEATKLRMEAIVLGWTKKHQQAAEQSYQALELLFAEAEVDYRAIVVEATELAGHILNSKGSPKLALKFLNMSLVCHARLPVASRLLATLAKGLYYMGVVHLQIDEPEELLCPISLCLMDDAVLAADGHHYQRGIFEEYIKRTVAKDRILMSPMTGAPMDSFYYYPDKDFCALVEAFLQTPSEWPLPMLDSKMQCPLGGGPMVEAVLAADGVHYQGPALKAYVEASRGTLLSPATRLPMSAYYVPDYYLRNTIKEETGLSGTSKASGGM